MIARSLLIGLFLLVPFDTGSTDEKAKEQKKLVLNTDAKLQKNDDEEIYFAKVDLGTLEVGRKARVNVDLENPFESTLRFHRVSNKCACKQVQLHNSVLVPKGKAKVSFDIDIPPRHKKKVVDSPITLLTKRGKAVIRLDLQYGLEGLLSFGGYLGVVRFDNLDETEKVLNIPILITDPLESEKVEASTSKNLSGIKLAIKSTADGPVLEAKIPESIVRGGNVRGDLSITYPETDLKDQYLITIKDARRSEISPKVLNFRKDGDTWKSTAIVRVAGNSKSDFDKESESRPIQCKIGDQELSVEVKALNSNTYRVSLFANESVVNGTGDSAGQRQVEWEIFNGRKSSTMKTEFTVQKD